MRGRHGPIAGAEDVGGRDGRPLAQRGHLLSDSPLLRTQLACGCAPYRRIAVVIEDLHGPSLRPGAAPIRESHRRFRWSETGAKVRVLSIEAEPGNGQERAEIDR